MHRKPHYAWAICLGCTVSMFAILGVCVNTFSVVLPYIRTQNGFSHTQVSLLPTVRMIFYLLSVAVSTQVCRRISYRLCVTGSAVLSTLAMVLYAHARTIAVCYAASALVGVGYGLGSTVPTSILMTRWFHEKRGLALGICSAGSGLATVVLSPVLVSIVERRGLAACFLFQAALCFAGALIALLLLRDSPESCGLEPYGERQEIRTHVRSAHTLHPAHSRWPLIYLSLAFVGGAISVSFQFLMTLNTSVGFRAMDASLGMSVFGFALMAGKLLLGHVCDRYGTRRANTVFSALLFSGLALCILAPLRLVPVMLAGTLLFGLGAPFSTVGISLWAADFSDVSHLDRTMQLFQMFNGLGVLVLSVVPGVTADLTGSYVPAYVILAVLGLIGMTVIRRTYRSAARGEAEAS